MIAEGTDQDQDLVNAEVATTTIKSHATIQLTSGYIVNGVIGLTYLRFQI